MLMGLSLARRPRPLLLAAGVLCAYCAVRISLSAALPRGDGPGEAQVAAAAGGRGSSTSASAELERLVAAVRHAAHDTDGNRLRTASLVPQTPFVAWNGVLTLAFTGFPAPLAQFKQQLSALHELPLRKVHTHTHTRTDPCTLRVVWVLQGGVSPVCPTHPSL